jgi:glycosyltransferase involved in cell wall biosynthesis
MTTFSIVTPCFNAGDKLLQTAKSVMSQQAVLNGAVRLQYIVVDGGSTDGSPERLREMLGSRVELVIERDRGMYDALAKGLSRAHGDIHAYINAGDFYHPHAFDTVLDVMTHTGAEWLTGSHFYCNATGQVIAFRLPFRYRRKAIRTGQHGNLLPAVQQESTFWAARLTRKIDTDRLRTYRLAGDNYIWNVLAGEVDLFIVSSYLGGFTYHGDHLSDAMGEYRQEMARHSIRAGVGTRLTGYLEFVMWRMPDRLKIEFNRRTLIRYHRDESLWRTGQ